MTTEDLSPDALTLYTFFDGLVTDDWQAIHAFGAAAAPLARWLPVPQWRTLWHELGAHRLIAHSVRANVECISRWRNRFPLDAERALTEESVKRVLAQIYDQWIPFTWDSWNDALLACGIQSEALWQLNKSFLILTRNKVIESRNRGTEVRVTQECIEWIFKLVPTS
jgi:hypothetical protein